MGGEKSFHSLEESALPGSPPHGRGKASFQTACLVRCRITPAWAGKSGQLFGGLVCAGDHPRMGGEKLGMVVLPSVW